MSLTTLQTVYADGVAVAQAIALVLGSLSILCTGLAHLPFLPARTAEFFARIGLATKKFSVNKRPPGDPEGPK